MFEMILMVSLGAFNAAPAMQPIQPVQIANFTTCQWPNKCKQETPAILAQFSPCVWPNKCKNTDSILS